MRSIALSLLSLCVLAACKDKQAAPTPGPTPPSDTPPDEPSEVWGPDGSCRLELGDEVRRSQPDGQAKGRLSGWYKTKPRDLDADTFLLECRGSQQIAVGLRSAPGLGTVTARRYQLDATHQELEAWVSVYGDRTDRVTGTLEVTRYDSERFVATVDLVAKIGKGEKNVTVRGTIDYPCVGFSGCKH